jgi:hypothetical protein
MIIIPSYWLISSPFGMSSTMAPESQNKSAQFLIDIVAAYFYDMTGIQQQFTHLFMLAIPVACIAWTVTNEEVFREPREYCVKQSKQSKTLLRRKFFYIFTCEYCFSHYVTLAVLLITHFKMIYDDWRGYFVSGFSLVWIANVYMSLFRRIRLDIKKQKTEVELKEEMLEKEKGL